MRRRRVAPSDPAVSRFGRSFFAVPLLALLWPSLALALSFGEGPVLLIADRIVYDEAAGVVRAEGNVEIARGDRRLLADAVSYDEPDDLMVA
ncbi:MAG: LptA/OstA family protein, partial [Geminicoccaceae bacterium]|nr:LptA/OstA family protein [Geminicoccaceae bacterium]